MLLLLMSLYGLLALGRWQVHNKLKRCMLRFMIGFKRIFLLKLLQLLV
ncbi:triosephosphate isomerase, chloroplastic [Iris pallida]|uniref:Triosephosphate isomerase, chloroplastic n=1 Tax=Iris pallida TaxID=29817 RepID=A0AAX6G426_IRIPA|nr:triosephosphate isomerase, chloroplastic [Iris pallida]KAJ6823439.1 triosephosphate isomerase, chloroplastic [Iris pallida]